MAKCLEFISARYRADISVAEQQEAMAGISYALTECDGFLECDHFYAAADARWITCVVWETEAAIEAAASIEDPPRSPSYMSGSIPTASTTDAFSLRVSRGREASVADQT